MKAKKERKPIKQRRKEVQIQRIRRQEKVMREKIGPMISEAEAWRMNLNAVIERLEPVISRDKFGGISFKKKLGKEQLEKVERAAKSYIEKYHALDRGYKRYVRLAKATGLEPAAFGEQLTITGKGASNGSKIRLASIEASRLLKAIEMQTAT